MPRLVSVWLPMWPIERMRRVDPTAVPQAEGAEPEPPFALVKNGSGGLSLTAVNARARAEGLRPGLALADARAALPALITRPAEPTRDRTALQALALWCGRYGPRRNVQGFGEVRPGPGRGKSRWATGNSPDADGLNQDGVWIDVTGVAHLFGGETGLLADLAARLEGFGLHVRIGLADTAGAAFALARFAAPDSRRPWTIAQQGQEQTKRTISMLPVEALRLAADEVVLLRRLGLSRIGQLYDVPREALALRFRGETSATSGKRRQEAKAQRLAGTVTSRLDQALGRAAEPMAALEEPPIHLVRRAFAEPLISAEGVAAATGELAHELCSLLDARGSGGSRFTLSLYRSDGSATQARVGTSRPARDPRHLIGLIAEKLAMLDAGFGIDTVTLAANQIEALAAHQATLPSSGGLDSGRDVQAARTAALVDRLTNRCGAAHVLCLQPAGSHIPERAWHGVPALAASRKSARGGAGTEMSEPSPRSAPTARRPQFLLSAPEPIAVTAEVPEGPPLRFTWRRCARRVVRSEGPERIEPEWWRSISHAGMAGTIRFARPRDYYAIEDTDGGRYWVFRHGIYGREADEAPPTWFMHGVFG